MSSMRNAVQRRPYRERGQPGEREKWGILEKHKDYALRARSHKAQREHLRKLRGLARDRNPDEFYYSMKNSQISKRDGTRVGDRGNKSLSVDATRLLKTQDKGYLSVMAEKARREARRVKESGAVALRRGQTPQGEKIRFAEDMDERGVEVGKLKTHDAEQTQAKEDEAEGTEADELANRRQQKREKRMEAAQSRYDNISAAERELDDQRARMAKHRSVGGVNRHGVKWRVRERKK